jgi:hypothetical protein
VTVESCEAGEAFHGHQGQVQPGYPGFNNCPAA